MAVEAGLVVVGLERAALERTLVGGFRMQVSLE